MNWLVLAGALAAVLVLGVIAAWLRQRGPDRSFTAPGEAMHAAEEKVAGFVALSAAVGSDGQAALVFGEGMRVVVLKASGGRVAAREVAWRDVRATREGLLVSNGERRSGSVLVAGVDNLDVRRLAPQLTRV